VKSKRSNRWTAAEDDRLWQMAKAGMTPKSIAAELNRLPAQIIARGYMIGLPLKWQVTDTKSGVSPNRVLKNSA
jgi:hypothetical protein